MEFKSSFIERFKPILKEEFDDFIEANKKPLKKSFRINRLKVRTEKDVKALLNRLKEKGLILKKVPWYDYGYFVEFREENRYDLGNLFEHFLGEIYIQEATSMIPPLVMDLESITSGSLILDVAAAPGSKATQIAELTNDKAIIFANEKDYSRLAPLKINFERLGAKNVIILSKDGKELDFQNQFDRILLDAPCSGSGIIRKSESAIKFYNPNKLDLLSNLQRKLFENAFHLLKKGGVLVYSTCSIDPEENEFLVEWALNTFKNLTLENIELKGIKRGKQIVNFNGKKVSKDIRNKVLRIWPQDNDTGGFFIAKFRKS